MRNVLLLLLGVTACGKSAASTPADMTDEAAVKAELVQLEKDWAQALEGHDTAFFERTLAEDFVATTGVGTTDRASMIKEVADTSMTFMNVGAEDQAVRLCADGRVAVVTGRVQGVVRMGDKKMDQLARYTEVFEKRDGRWQAVTGHYSPLQEPK